MARKTSKIRQFELPTPTDLRTSSVTIASESYLVLSYELPAWRVPDTLTPAERRVLQAILDGKSRKQVARERNTSIRTVSNLINAAFRKLGVQSRIEAAAKLTVRAEEARES
jgi:DNA-binding NarL/FixJ family response regulator